MDLSLPPDPSSVRLAREFVADAVGACSADTTHSAALLVSELATNAVLHARSSFVVSVEQGDGSVRISVTDHGEGRPTVGDPQPDEDHGRGLLIVQRLSHAWGVEATDDGGKRVWFDLTC